jgi:hypothetical protein
MVPSMSDEDRALYRIVGAGLVWENMQVTRALVGAIRTVKK